MGSLNGAIYQNVGLFEEVGIVKPYFSKPSLLLREWCDDYSHGNEINRTM